MDGSTVRHAMGIPEIIEGIVKECGSVNAAARQIGMPESTLHRIRRGERVPTLETLRLIARAKGLPLYELVRLMDEDFLPAKGARATVAGSGT